MTPLYLLYPEVTMGHISTLKLHQLRYGELSESEQSQLREHLAVCPHCRARLQAMENHRAAFELMPVPEAIHTAARPSLWQRLARPAVLSPFLAAAMAMLFVIQSPPLTERTKGDRNKDIEILVEDVGVLDLAEGDAIRPGDRIQLRIPPGEWVEVWVGDGESWLGGFPVQPSKTWQLVPFSLEVDDAPGAEQIVVLLSNHPIDEGEASDALDGDSSGGIEVEYITLPKEL